MTSAQRISITTVTFLVMAVTIFLFALNGYSPLIAVVGGVWWGGVPILLLFGGTMAIAPARMIRWREGAMTQRGYQTRIGSWFSKQLGVTGPRPWESAVARHRVRTLGMLEVVVGLGVGVGLLFLRS
jgi:hypothetical protein